MKPKFQLAACFSTLLFASATVHADIVTWIGPATGGDFFEPSNWDDSTGPTAGTPFVGDLVISDTAAVGGTGGGLILASGSTFTATNCTIDITFGLQSVTNLTTDGTINLINSTINTSSIANDLVANLTALSVLNLNGTGNAVNGTNTPTNNTRVNLADGCKVSQINGNNASNAGSQSVGSRIFRTASGTSFETDFASLPLTEFTLTGDQTPFVAPNGGAFTITAADPNGRPDIIVGYRLVPPEASQVIWYPTYRTATDWQINLDNPQIAFFGWAGITDVYLADLNGDGLSDKVMRQTANNGGTNPSQIIATYTTAPPTGFATSNSFTAPAGDIDVPFGFLSASKTDLVFGDIDGDKIDDSGVYVEASEVGGSAGVMVWGILKSNGQIGISADQGGFSNFVGWAAFGEKALGDKPYMGDFNGDGIADRLIYRVSTNQAFIDLSVLGGFGDGVADYGPISIGIPGDRLYVTDINGDGKDDLALGRDTNLLPPPEETPGLQTLFGYYNDGTGFSTLNGASPDIIDFWGAGEGVLFGNITPLPADMSSFQITQITSAGPELAFSGTFFAPVAGSYEIQANLDLTSPWQLMDTVVAASSGPTPFSISDAQLDSTFGPSTRPKVFIRAVKQP